MSEIVLVSSERSGTNYLCDTMGNFRGLVNFLELFSPAGVFGLQWHPAVVKILSDISGVDFFDQNSGNLVRHVAQNRIAFLEQLNEAVRISGNQNFGYKIFPNQVSHADLNEIVSNDRRVFVFLARNRLDTFISFKKAIKSGNWVNLDSKDLKIEVDLDEFMSWAENLDRWYAETERKVRDAGRKYCFLSYDADINVQRGNMIEKVYLSLRAMGVDIQYPINAKPPTFQRQDGPGSPFDKISNGMALKQRLSDERLLVRYALRTSLTPRPKD